MGLFDDILPGMVGDVFQVLGGDAEIELSFTPKTALISISTGKSADEIPWSVDGNGDVVLDFTGLSGRVPAGVTLDGVGKLLESIQVEGVGARSANIEKADPNLNGSGSAMVSDGDREVYTYLSVKEVDEMGPGETIQKMHKILIASEGVSHKPEKGDLVELGDNTLRVMQFEQVDAGTTAAYYKLLLA